MADDGWTLAPDDPRCPGCFGWGFPVFKWNGREARKPGVTCPQCNGTGKRAEATELAANEAAQRKGEHERTDPLPQG